MTEKLQLRCGNCAWYRAVDVPKEMQPPDFTPRGHCYAEPPTVYPMPVPKKSSNLALVQGQQQGMDIVPAMIRPVVEEAENMCGSYAPNTMARKALDEIQAKRNAGCGDKPCDKERCNCGD